MKVSLKYIFSIHFFLLNSYSVFIFNTDTFSNNQRIYYFYYRIDRKQIKAHFSKKLLSEYSILFLNWGWFTVFLESHSGPFFRTVFDRGTPICMAGMATAWTVFQSKQKSIRIIRTTYLIPNLQIIGASHTLSTIWNKAATTTDHYYNYNDSQKQGANYCLQRLRGRIWK